jgi:hypothetical protein
MSREKSVSLLQKTSGRQNGQTNRGQGDLFLIKRTKNTSKKSVRPKGLLRRGRSPSGAKSVWLATGFFIAAGISVPTELKIP